MKRKQVTEETNMKFGLIAPSWHQRTPQGNCDSRGHIHCLKIRSCALRELDIKTDWLNDCQLYSDVGLNFDCSYQRVTGILRAPKLHRPCGSFPVIITLKNVHKILPHTTQSNFPPCHCLLQPATQILP
jgi:hypothetical protein